MSERTHVPRHIRISCYRFSSKGWCANISFILPGVSISQMIEQWQRWDMSKLWVRSSREVLTNLMHTTWDVYNCTSLNGSPLQDTQLFTLPNLTVTISCHEMRWVSFLREIPQIRHGSLNSQFRTEIGGKVPPFPQIRFIWYNFSRGNVQADFTQTHFSDKL